MKTHLDQKEISWGTPTFWINVFPLYYGRSRGFFEQAGIHLKMAYFHGGPELAKAVRQRTVQMGTMGMPPFCRAYSEGIPARILGSALIQKLDIYLVSHTGIERVQDLRGKRIGLLSFGSCDNYFIRHILQAEGVSPDKEVDFVALQESYGKLSPILERWVDAACYTEPTATLAEYAGTLHILARVGDYFPRYQWSILFAEDGFLSQEGELMRRLLEAYRRSCVAIREEPRTAEQYGKRLFQMDGGAFRAMVGRSSASWCTDLTIDEEGLESAVRIQRTLEPLGDHVTAANMVFSPNQQGEGQ